MASQYVHLLIRTRSLCASYSDRKMLVANVVLLFFNLRKFDFTGTRFLNDS